jgi:hypothetical protein
MLKSCRTCIYWDKPASSRALADRWYGCRAPRPDLSQILPAALVPAFTDRYMERNDGASCPAWRDDAPTFKPAQVTLLEAAEALLEYLEGVEDDLPVSLYSGVVDVLRQAIQREKAK